MTSKDPLLEKARQAEKNAERSKDAADDAAKGSKSAWGNAFEALKERLQNAPPFLSFFGNVLAWIFKILGVYFKWACFLREKGQFKRDEEGDLIFSGARLGKSLLATVVVFSIAHFTLAAIYYYSTQFEELIYTTGKQEIVCLI